MKYPAKRSRVVKLAETREIEVELKHDGRFEITIGDPKRCARCPEPITTRRVKDTPEGLVHASCANEGAW